MLNFCVDPLKILSLIALIVFTFMICSIIAAINKPIDSLISRAVSKPLFTMCFVIKINIYLHSD